LRLSFKNLTAKTTSTKTLLNCGGTERKKQNFNCHGAKKNKTCLAADKRRYTQINQTRNKIIHPSDFCLLTSS